MNENNYNNPFSQPEGFGQSSEPKTEEASYTANNSYSNTGFTSNSYGSGQSYNTNQTYSANQGYSSNQGYSANQGYSSDQGYNNGSYQTYQSSSSYQGAPKKKSSFGGKLMKCVAMAAVFGLVAGCVFNGVNYGADKLLGTNTTNTSSNASIAISKTSSSASTQLTDVSELVDEAMKSCVAITNTYTYTSNSMFGFGQKSTYEATSCGSGIIISQDENYLYIVSNNHVVEDADALTVQFCDGTTVAAEIKGTDASTDLAVIKVELDSISAETKENIATATIGDSASLKVGNACIAIGNALGYGQSVTTGVVSALDRSITVSSESSNDSTTYNGLIQTDAAINPGNSGGALLNAKGEVIGINSAKYSDTTVEGVGYAISMADALPIIEQLITSQKVDTAKAGYLGIQGYDVSEDVANAYNIPQGVYVYQSLQGYGAAKGGISSGDVIVGLNGTTITSMEQLQDVLSYYEAGTTVSVTVAVRSENYEEKTIDVVLSSK